MTNEPPADTRASDPAADVEVIADLDARDDDVDVINGGDCGWTAILCALSRPTH